jgi:LuxR family transcriptional regulator, maltose regulon positive regulatory protein
MSSQGQPVHDTIPLLETKLFVPRWPENLVARSGLLDRLHQGSHRKLTVLCAPAGSGKTTLLAEWLAQRPGAPPVGWLSLDSADNEPASFWTCVIRALQKVDAAVGQQALDAIQTGSAPTVATLTSLLNEITRIDRDVVLILDDYHVIDDPAVQTALAFFIDHLPPRMHLVLATRTEPLLPLARLRARDDVTEMRAADLRFTPAEASQFFNRVMALDLSARDIETLETRTEGWIAGLKLAALSMKNHDDVSAFIRSFAGDNRFVADYLVAEVLQAQPERTRWFLLATAILERLGASLCDALTGEPGSQALLETMERSNLFVVAMDDRREWYRYHHLFAEMLRTHAMRADPERIRELHRRASLWYQRNGSTPDAVHHAMHANDLDRVAELLERTWPNMDRTYRSARWLARVKALPEALVRTRPLLNMGYAWALLNAGELEAAEQKLHDVEATLNGGSSSSLERELASARVYLAQSRGDFRRSIEHARHGLELVPADDPMSRATALALLALAYWAHGELEAAHDTFAAALDTMRSAGRPLDAIRGMFVLADLRAAQGRLHEAVRGYQAGLAMAAAHSSAEVIETDELYLGLSEVHRERGELGEAEQLLLSMQQRASRAGHTANRHRWCTAMSRVAAAHGDFDRASSLLQDAEAAYRRDPLPIVRPFAAMRARIWIAQGKVADAARWANERDLSDDDELSFLREYDHFTRARLLVSQDQPERAITLLERLTIAARTGGRTGSVIEALTMQALAHERLGNTVAALDAIGTALELAEPEGYLRVFVDEARPMRDLLRHAAARGVAGAYTRRVLAGFEEAVVSAAPGASNGGVSRVVQLLTPRELEILRLIAAGMRNQEIAKQLFISPATVKRHIANLYHKLDARHRTEALNRATALNLL